MTRDDILRWAQQAWDNADASFFESFAALVAAHERERVARWMIENGYATGHGDDIEDLLRHLVLEERESCAQVCDAKVEAEYATGKVDHNEIGWTQACAAAIRARGTP